MKKAKVILMGLVLSAFSCGSGSVNSTFNSEDTRSESISENIVSNEETISQVESENIEDNNSEEGIYSGDISISYEEENFSSLDEVEVEQKEWKKFKDGKDLDVATTTNGVTTFTSSNPSYSDLFYASVDGSNYYNIVGPTKEVTPIIAKEFVYSMDIVSEGDFKMVLFASEETDMNYTAEDVVNNVAPKMGVYLTFKPKIVEMTMAIANGNVNRCASAAIGAISTNATMVLDGVTSNNIKISLERSTVLNEENKVMMKLYINDNLITFRKLVVTNNEENLGFSLRTEWENGVTDGFSIFSSTPSGFIRISEGISETEGLGSGFGIVTTNKTTMSNFKVYNAN